MSAASGGPESVRLETIAVGDDHHCFGCGRLNTEGLRLRFFVREDGPGLWTAWTPEARHEGFTGIAHGGIITTVLDEVMGWAIFQRGLWAVTGRLSVTFRQPVEIGVGTRAVAWIAGEHGRKIDVVGELRREGDGVLLAQAEAMFIQVRPEQAEDWQARYRQGQAVDGS